ncbi:MAG: hypothetical protein M1275_01545 [Patescibacteria group bacterium]|nr:hypothetical protein [Patescibacteria group bacterium]
MKKQVLIYSLIIATAATTRLVPHAWNFAPITAVAIVAAIYLPLTQALVLPLAIRFVSDAIIGFFSWPLMLAVYTVHLFGAVMGRWAKAHKTSTRILLAPVVSAGVFFLVTNFAFLYPNYSHDWSGIITAYANGLPFLRGTLAGDVIYTATFVGVLESVWAWQRNKMLAIKLVR